ncbi:MAG: family ATPase [Frondihabitans sp.]|nr:family ATPase [Frondihabitans sp.]
MTDPLLDALRRAVLADPTDAALRKHLGEMLLTAGERDEAVAIVAPIVASAPDDAEARELLRRALSPKAPAATTETEADSASGIAVTPGATNTGFDWHRAEEQVEDLVAPAFVDEAAAPDPESPLVLAERPCVTLADVGGMTAVKERLRSSFLEPLKNPELRRLYGKSLRGGLLLYGPPGCGKTYIAKALAGELGAAFLSIGLSDILDPFLGNSERNVHETFQLARRQAPCVLFIDEIDALGQRRSQTRNSAIRGTVNQMLTELDGVTGVNDDVFVLAATNQPWDVDPALRRPGRFDRTVLVLPPDLEARESIFHSHLQGRPVEGIEAKKLAKASEGLSGADIAYVCELSAESAMSDSVKTGVVRMIRMGDLENALAEVRPSTGSWLDSARNVVMFGEDDGTYAELRSYLKKMKRL